MNNRVRTTQVSDTKSFFRLFRRSFPRLGRYLQVMSYTERYDFIKDCRRLISDHHHYGEQAIVLSKGNVYEARKLITDKYQGIFSSINSYLQLIGIDPYSAMISEDSKLSTTYAIRQGQIEISTDDNIRIIHWHHDINMHVHIFEEVI